MTAEKLNTAIQLIQSGNRQAAVPVLREIIQENPVNESAWMWLYSCMDQVEHKKFCLQSVLEINPANQQARDALAALTEPAPAPAAWIESEKVEQGITEQEAELERVETLKMEWEKDESDEVTWERVEPKKVEREKMEWEKEEQAEAPPLKIEWDDWDEAEPAGIKPLKQKPAKAPSRPTPRRKARSKSRSFFPILLGVVLLLMFSTVCLVFLAQIFILTP